MIDGILLGALVFFFGAASGAGIVMAVVWHYERERETLHQIIGRYQQAMEQGSSIPLEEM